MGSGSSKSILNPGNVKFGLEDPDLILGCAIYTVVRSNFKKSGFLQWYQCRSIPFPLCTLSLCIYWIMPWLTNHHANGSLVWSKIVDVCSIMVDGNWNWKMTSSQNPRKMSCLINKGNQSYICLCATDKWLFQNLKNLRDQLPSLVTELWFIHNWGMMGFQGMVNCWVLFHIIPRGHCE
jgi:hypothetical protein